MSRFLDIALRNAARGLRVFPVRAGTKEPHIKNFPDLATSETAQIEQWAWKWPEANCGNIGDDVHLIVDTDRWAKMQELFAEQLQADPALFDTYCISAREDRRQFVFLQTERSRSMQKRNLDYAVPGEPDNVFEFKSHRKLGMGEGSIHKTGKTYLIVQDRPFKPVPDALIERAEELYRSLKQDSPEGSGQPLPLDNGSRHNALVQVAGSLRRAGLSPAAIEVALLQHCADSLSDDSDFDVEGECQKIAASATWPIPEPEPHKPTIGGSIRVEPEEAVQPARKRPIYPISVWDGTAAGEFAKLCSNDNNIPRKFFVEAWNCVLGAVVGDRLTASIDGGIPRSYTFLITKAGKGKGTVIRRTTGFWKATWSSSRTSAAQGLLRGEPDFIWKPQGIGARNASASSGPGMTRLTLEGKNTPVHLSWSGTIPRIISVHEETKTFLSALFIEGGTGANLDGVVCSLWDDVEFAAPGTGTRQAVYGEMQFSLLCAITEDDWFDLLSKGDVVGGGLMSRLNLVGSLGEYDNVATINPHLDFEALQKQVLPRIERMVEAPCVIAPTEGARRVMAEWHLALPADAVRANIRAWRAALLLSFLRQEDHISEKTAMDATLLGDYQLGSHSYYTVLKADNPLATVQYKILRALEMHGPLKKGRLQDYTNARRVGTELWSRALDGLVRDGRVGKREEPRGCTYYLAAQP